MLLAGSGEVVVANLRGAVIFDHHDEAPPSADTASRVPPIQIIAGDQHGLNTLEHQPVKIMAMEGHFESHKDGAPLFLFGWPNESAGRVDYAVEIPKLGSLILKH